MVGRARGIGARLTRITARGLLILAIAHLNNCPFQQLQGARREEEVDDRRAGADAANSASLNSRSPSSSMLANLFEVVTTHSSKVNRLLPSTYSLRNALLRLEHIPGRVMGRSRLQS